MELERISGCPVAPGRLLIRPGGDEEALTNHIRNLGFTFVRDLELARAQLWLAPKSLPVARAMRIVRRLPGAPAVEPDYVRTLSQAPNDPDFSEQYAAAKMHMPQAWDLTTGGADTIVAVIDSGVQYDHADLAGNMYANDGEVLDGIDNDGNGYVDDIIGWDFLSGSYSDPGQDNDPADIFGHGTEVAGVAGAVANNAVGIAGVAWQVRIMPLKIGGDPELPFLSTIAAIEAIDYAVAQGANVINASYIGYSYSHFEIEALQSAQDANVIVVAAAGNDSADIDQTPSYPSAYNLANVLSVAATDSADDLTSFSNYGIKTVDLAAPGSNIYTTTVGNGFRSTNGTSFASPQVAGIAALMRTVFPAISVQTLRLMMMEGTDAISSLAGKAVTGGRANAFSALSAQIPWAKTYGSVPAPPRAIPDNDPAGITDAINVPGDLNIRAVSVTVKVKHPRIGDIGLTIESPSGTVNTLKSPSDNDHAGFTYTFDTQWDFRGEATTGDWRLTVSDNSPQDAGTLFNWSLEIYIDAPNEDVNGDGCVNVLDLLAVRNALHLQSADGREDVNRDGTVNILDMLAVRNKLGTCEGQ